MDYFIIHPRDHQFAIQRYDGLILRYFDGVTYSDVKSYLEDFLQGRFAVQLSLWK